MRSRHAVPAAGLSVSSASETAAGRAAGLGDGCAGLSLTVDSASPFQIWTVLYSQAQIVIGM